VIQMAHQQKELYIKEKRVSYWEKYNYVPNNAQLQEYELQSSIFINAEYDIFLYSHRYGSAWT